MPKAADVLKFRDSGLSVEEARKKMLEAGEAPKGKATPVSPAVADALEPELEATAEEPPVQPLEPEVLPEVPQEAPKPEAPVPPPPVVAAAPEPQKPQRIETNQFIAEIKQDGNRWVAEIAYKTALGASGSTEKFIARSKNELMMKLLEGKGHATLRVKQAVRREKLGREVDRQYQLPSGVSAEQFDKMPEEAKKILVMQLDVTACHAFRAAHPEHFATLSIPENSDAIIKFCDEQKIPLTQRNLEYAFEELVESGVIELPQKESKVETVLAQPEEAPVAVDSAPAAKVEAKEPLAPEIPQPVPQPQVVVRKRASSGLRPEQSSLPSGGEVVSEEGRGSKEPSEAELRKMPIADLKRIVADQRRRQAALLR